MVVSMQNAELIRKLVLIAGGDIELVQRAIRATAQAGKGADLKRVVEFIQRHKASRSDSVFSQMSV